MKSASLHRVTRKLPLVVVALLGTYLSSAPVSNAQSVIAITNWDGTVLPSAAHLYTTSDYCYNPHPTVTVCTWVLRKIYGDNSAVAVVAHYPAGQVPACGSGVTQHLTSGYSRSFCSITATAAVYGQ
jgi:hypothetical protein